MVEYSDIELDRVFRALSDATRRKMLARMAHGEVSVSELAEPFDMSLAAISKHLKVLEAADFVERTKDGRSYRCRARLEPLAGVTEVLEQLGGFWRERLDVLENILTTGDSAKGAKHGKGRKGN